uniref:Uncharacterized protein n=1 Tax=Anopheles farauti TaxID=69004 RepID=A0A182QYK3_9DIPT
MVLSPLVLVALALAMPVAHAFCTASVTSGRLSSCAFHPLLLVVARSGWVLSRQNCAETIDPRALEDPPVLYYDLAEPDHLYTVTFVAEPNTSTGRYLQWLVVNVPESSLINGMMYMDGDTIVDYLSPAPARSVDDDEDDDDDDDGDGGDADGQPTRYAFYVYEQVYGTIYPPTPSTRDSFDLDGWISTIYPEASLCGPVASIGFGSVRQ